MDTAALGLELEKLSLVEGDMLVLRNFEGAHFKKLMEAAKIAGIKPRIPVIFLDGEQTIEKLDEETMRAKGWVRASGE